MTQVCQVPVSLPMEHNSTSELWQILCNLLCKLRFDGTSRAQSPQWACYLLQWLSASDFPSEDSFWLEVGVILYVWVTHLDSFHHQGREITHLGHDSSDLLDVSLMHIQGASNHLSCIAAEAKKRNHNRLNLCQFLTFTLSFPSSLSQKASEFLNSSHN